MDSKAQSRFVRKLNDTETQDLKDYAIAEAALQWNPILVQWFQIAHAAW